MLAAGSQLGRYEILAPLGAGGMGQVYRARDPELGREVAVKILPDEVADDPDRLRRFRAEARAAGSLSHPNVAAVHDLGVESGRLFLVTELVDGTTLRRRLDEGPLPPRAAMQLALQLARGLAAAHDRGIVHRDLKPENVCLCADGTAKIVDFGIARLAPPEGAGSADAPTLTAPGTVVGTAGYMAPEQARGEAADARADLFAFGAIVYETLAGRRAFPGRTAVEALAAVLHTEPPPLPESADRLAPALARIARRCLEREPDARFQSARDVAFALEALAGETIAASAPAAGPERRTRPALAVLLFQDLSAGGGNEHLSVGLADAVVAELAGRDDLVVRPTSAVLRYRDRRLSPAEAGSELDVDVVLDGSFQRAGERLRITVQLVSIAEARPLWAAKIDGSLDDVFSMQDTVARNVAEALALALAPAGGEDGEKEARARPRVPAGAYESYLRGKFHLHREGLEDVRAAVDALEEACRAAPGFALAQVGLGEACLRMAWTFEPEGGWYERAEEAGRRALELDPELPEALYLRGRLRWSPQHSFDHAEGIRSLHGAVTARPNLHDAHHYLGVVLNHVGLLDEASAAMERAAAIDPDDLVVRNHLAFNRVVEGRYGDALDLVAATSSRAPTPWSRYCEASCHLRLGDLDRARAAAADVSTLFPTSVWIDTVEGLLAAVAGDRQRALAAVERIAANEKAYGHYHHAQHDVAVVLTQLGELDRGLEWLAAAAANGFPCAPAFRTDPLLHPLAGHPGFETLLGRLDDERSGYRRLLAELRTPRHVADVGDAGGPHRGSGG